MRRKRLVDEPVWIARELGIGGRLIDIGSGNGSPAIPICMTRPVEAAILIESRLKRAAFLRHLADTLKLSSVSVLRSRFEEALPELRAFDADWITFQAVFLDKDLMEALARVASEKTQIVWITARAAAPKREARSVHVPNSETEAWIFGFSDGNG